MNIQNYGLTSGATIVALLIYFWVTVRVGQARGKYGVSAPATTGAPGFEIAFRIHQNTLEQIVFFLPSLWLFAAYIGDLWAGLGGMIWAVGRVLYVLGYTQDPAKRGTGFGIAAMASLAMLIGATVGWLMQCIK